MYYLNYERLTRVTKEVKPFRGTTDRYPIGSRSQNNKCFYVDKEGDNTIYKITYGNSYKEHPVTREQYAEACALGLKGYSEISWRDANAPDRFVRYTHHPRVMLIVRHDNSVEFTASGYGQGDNMILSNWSRGYVYRSSRHGGMVYRQRWDGVETFHPIFKGMRLDCDTMQAITPYQITGRRVMRKTAKEFLKQYVDFYKVSHAMMKSMRPEDFLGVASDLVKELGIGKNSWGGLEVNSDKLHQEAQARLHTSPFDSAVLYCMAHDYNTVRRVSHYIDSTQWNPYGEYDLLALFDSMKRKLNKEIYRNNDSVMKSVEYESGKPYPASEWGVTITVDGKEVEQY